MAHVLVGELVSTSPKHVLFSDPILACITGPAHGRRAPVIYCLHEMGEIDRDGKKGRGAPPGSDHAPRTADIQIVRA